MQTQLAIIFVLNGFQYDDFVTFMTVAIWFIVCLKVALPMVKGLLSLDLIKGV